MRLLISGHREYTDYDYFSQVLEGLPVDVIIHGNARGADTLAQRYATEHNIPVEVYPADWNKHGRAAGPIRNRQMITEGKPDYCVAFLHPSSKGTKDMINACKKHNIYTETIHI